MYTYKSDNNLGKPSSKYVPIYPSRLDTYVLYYRCSPSTPMSLNTSQNRLIPTLCSQPLCAIILCNVYRNKRGIQSYNIRFFLPSLI